MRFLHAGLDGLLDEPRPGTPRKLSDQQVELVLTRTLESQPEAATHWSTRDMAKACGLSQSTISRIWRAFSLAPHRAETFKLSRDPLFIEKVRDIVGLYLDPPDRALVLCVDEKSQIQALDRTAPLLPMRPGQIPTTTSATAPPACSPHSTRSQARSSARPSNDTVPGNSATSSIPSRRMCLQRWTFT
jgi:transcriptional regulator with XRE-family HTH domain